MKKLIVTILLLISNLLGITAQVDNNYPEDYVPKSIKSALLYLENLWSDEDKESFKNAEESEAIASLHFGTGLGIRNGWGLWAKKRNSLVREFNSLGITHPDDMSSFVLTLFHRKLNSSDFDLKSEKLKRKMIQEEIFKKDLQLDKDIRRRFNDYQIGDSIEIPLPITASGNKIYFGYYSNRTDWKSLGFDCIVKGIIEKKTKQKGLNLTIKITEVWFADERYYEINTTRRVGDVFQYNIKYFAILE